MSSPVIFFIFFIPTLAYSSEYVIYVDGVNGHNDSNCLQPHGHPCQSLEYVQRNIKSVTNHSLVIEICNPGISLTAALIFRDFVDLSIRGRGAESMDQSTINCSTSNSGLLFFNITGLSLSFIRVTNCGTKSYITEHFNRTLMSALYILNCVNANINNSILYMSNGTGVEIHNTIGQVSIENTDILKSHVRSAGSNPVYGGSGLFIGFTNCTSSLISKSCISDGGHNSNAMYTIRNCKFFQNVVNVSTNKSDVLYPPISSGGGAYVVFKSNATNISVTFSNCTFQNNYALYFGGGMRVLFQDSVQNNKVSLHKTVFLSNSVSLDNAFGGGLQISVDFVKEYEDDGLPKNNTVNITLCNFKGNSAYNGGGVSIFSTQIPLYDTHSTVHFSKCTWTGNTALYGAAVHVAPGIWASEKDSRFPLFVFSDSNVFSNKVIPRTKETYQSNMGHGLETQFNGAGAFFCTQINIVFAEETSFIRNNGTALYLSGSIALFRASSQVLFDSNNGTNGGAIALLGQSLLFPQSPSTFSFTNNTARKLGGGIYFESTSQNIQQPCFIYHGYRRENLNFTFMSNRAGSGRGHHIYVSSFTSCSIYCNNTFIYDCIGDFSFYDPHSQTDSTATPPTQFSLNTTHSLTIFPGLPTTLPLIVKDSENNSVSNMSYEAVLENINSQINIDPAFIYISNNTINIQGKPEGNATLRLDPSSTDISLLMEIVLVECPPGYILENGKCECGSSYYHGVLKCDPDPSIRYGTWMGRCNHTNSQLCTSPCPVGYCLYRNLYEPLPSNEVDLEQTICSPKRTGFSCGSCKPNHSVYYNSWIFECGKEDRCHLGVLFYIVSTLIPLTILFLGIVVLDTNIVNGWNGFLFFAQIVVFLPIHADGIIYFPTLLNDVLRSLLFVYGFFSLDFFDLDQLSFCFWKGATVMDILMVQLISICFALSLVFLTVFVLKQHKLAKCFPCLLRRRYTVINGLSAFFTLCYARCAWICFMILAPACIYDYNFRCLRTIAFYSGSLTYFKGTHIIYAVVAIIFFIFIVILPALLLLFYPLFFRFLGLCNLSESRSAMFLWRKMPIQLLDSFQNPFKNEHRYFAGLYFLYRAVAIALRLFTDHLTELVFGLELEFIVIIVLHAAFHPYKERVHNIIDLLLFFNLAFINWITTYNLETSSVALASNAVVFWMTVQILLLCLPLASATIFIIIKMLTSLKKALKENMYIPIQPKT